MNFLRYTEIVAGCPKAGWCPPAMTIDMSAKRMLLSPDKLSTAADAKDCSEGFEFVKYEMEHVPAKAGPLDQALETGPFSMTPTACQGDLWTRKIFEILEKIPITTSMRYPKSWKEGPPIRIWMDCAFDEIRRNTLGAVKPDQVRFVMHPSKVGKLARSEEVGVYFEGDSDKPLGVTPLVYLSLNPNAKLYGYSLVEETLAGNDVYVLSQCGTQVMPPGCPTFSSVSLMVEPQLQSAGEIMEREIEDYHIWFSSPVSTLKLEGALP